MSWLLFIVLMQPSETGRIEFIPTANECETVKEFVVKNWPRVRAATCIPQNLKRSSVEPSIPPPTTKTT